MRLLRVLPIVLLACAHVSTRAEVLEAAKVALLECDQAFSVWHRSEIDTALREGDEDRIETASATAARWDLLVEVASRTIEVAENEGRIEDVGPAMDRMRAFLVGLRAKE